MYSDALPIRILRTVARVQNIEQGHRESKSSLRKNECSLPVSPQRKSSTTIGKYNSFKYSRRDIIDDYPEEDAKKEGEGVRRRLHEYLACREEDLRRWAEGNNSSKEPLSFSSFNNSNSINNKRKCKNGKSTYFDNFNSAQDFHEEVITPRNEAKIIWEKPHPVTLPWPIDKFFERGKTKGISASSSSIEKEEKEELLLEKGRIPLRMVDTKDNSKDEMGLSSLSFEELSELLSYRHRSRCRRLNHVFNHYNNNYNDRYHYNSYQPRNLWEGGLPVFAMADTAPQVMDLDLHRSASRVARCTQDKGVVVI